MSDEFDMYGSDDADNEQPTQLGPMAMLARKVDRLEAELRSTKEDLAVLRRMLDGGMRNMQQLRNKMVTTETSLDSIRKLR